MLLMLCLATSACAASKPVADTSDSHRPEYVAAANELRKLAEDGNVRAQHGLGLLYQAGRGVPQSYGQAKRWFEEAARQGHAEAQVNLGTSYLHGDPPPQSSQMALYWFDRAAEQGNVAAFANLGAMYAEAHGVPLDLIQAYTWFFLAAESGDESSAHRRDLLAAKMSPAQIAQAQERAHAWKPTSKSVAWKLFTSSTSVVTDDSSR
jgi:TPR repeat protein